MRSTTTTAGSRPQRLKALRILFILVGAVIIVLAIFADRLGYGSPGSLGVGQLLLALVGLAVALIGLLGKRIVELYRGVAILLLNTVVLLALLELGAIIIARSSQNYNAEIQRLPYYSDKDWTETYFQEAFAAENFRYKPYVTWGHLPFSGHTMNLDQEGFRETPGAECSPEAYKLFAFGGSTMLGWGAPDWGTIPAYLQRSFDELMEGPVCIVNLGQSGFVSTQSVVSLILQLQSGNIPDAVIFYDGVNEVQAAYESGQPVVHVNLARISARFEEQEHPLLRILKASRLYALFKNWRDNSARKSQGGNLKIQNYQTQGADTDSLAKAVAGVYLRNYEIVGVLAEGYDFEYFFFLQPHLAVGQKPLTEEEQSIKSNMDPALIDLTNAVYEEIASAAAGEERLWNMASVFNGEDSQIWIDSGGHITPEGNRLVAREISTLIENDAR